MFLRFQNRLRWKETNVKKLATLLVLISLGTGCTVGPNYKRPNGGCAGRIPRRRAFGGRRTAPALNLVRRKRRSNRDNRPPAGAVSGQLDRR